MDLSEHGASLIWSKTYFFQSALDVPNSPNLIWSIMCMYTYTNYTDLTYYCGLCPLYELYLHIVHVICRYRYRWTYPHFSSQLPRIETLHRCLESKICWISPKGIDSQRISTKKKNLGILKQQSRKAGTCEKLVIKNP